MSDGFKLNAPFEAKGPQKKTIDDLVSGLEQGLWQQTLWGITGCGKTFIMANLIRETNRPALILAHNKTLAAQLYHEMSLFFPEHSVELFVSYYDYYQPEAYVVASDTYIAKDAAINEHIEQMRLSATKAILEKKDTIIVASVSAIYGLGDPSQYLKMVLHLRVGHSLNQRELLRQLAHMQYTRNDTELKRGTFRVHGDVIDIFPADQEKEAIRLELFDEDIEAIRMFDPLTGTILQRLTRVTVHPKTHYVTPKSVLNQAIVHIEKELTERLAELNDQGRLVEAQRLSERTRFDCEMMGELGYCTGIENYSRYLSGRSAGKPPPTLMDYLPKNALLFIDESHVTLPQLRGMYHGDQSRKHNLVHYGFRLPSAKDNRPLQFSEFLDIAPQMVFVSATPGPYEKEESGKIVELNIRPTGLLDPLLEVRPARSQVEDALSEIHAAVEKKERVLLTTLTKKMAEYLSDFFTEHGVKTRYLHSDIDTVERVEILRDLRLGTFDVLIGINLLREGLDLPEVGLVLIFDADKMGFLRSESSLIQTVGRAARHLSGRAILYAEKITDAMQGAIDQTKRRRALQEAYNKAHDQVPQQLNKKAAKSLDLPEMIAERHKEADGSILSLSPQAFGEHLKAMEAKMLNHADMLEFEKSARIRDEMLALKKRYFEGK